LKVARTIADLEDVIEVAPSHIAEALRYRPLSRSAPILVGPAAPVAQ
jgi:predicted ATPase with chaperone activity